MKIISHRGYWRIGAEKNTTKSFIKSFSEGFGVETDFRDFKGELVVSHDIPKENALSVDVLLDVYNKYVETNKCEIAINIKSDGLQQLLLKKLVKYKIENYFVFDMSIPDTIGYIDCEIKFFVRQSEIEKELLFYEKADGVWLDCFYSDWVSEKVIENHLINNKRVCLVSSELHNRGYQDYWKRLNEMEIIKSDKVFICTDLPKIAKEYFL